MKRHKTDTLEVSADFENRFRGAWKASRRIKPELPHMIRGRGKPIGRWLNALRLWLKFNDGTLPKESTEAVRRDYRAEWAYFASHGNRIPEGVR